MLDCAAMTESSVERSVMEMEMGEGGE